MLRSSICHGFPLSSVSPHTIPESHSDATQTERNQHSCPRSRHSLKRGFQPCNVIFERRGILQNNSICERGLRRKGRWEDRRTHRNVWIDKWGLLQYPARTDKIHSSWLDCLHLSISSAANSRSSRISVSVPRVTQGWSRRDRLLDSEVNCRSWGPGEQDLHERWNRETLPIMKPRPRSLRSKKETRAFNRRYL